MKLSNKNHTCFICGETIDKGVDKSYMIGLEKPYVNLFLHFPQCKNIIDEIGLEKYLLEHYNEILKYDEHPVKIRKNKIEESEEEEIGQD